MLLLLQLYGFFYSGPVGHFLHKMMDKIFKGKKGNTTVGKKVRVPISHLFLAWILWILMWSTYWSLWADKFCFYVDFPEVFFFSFPLSRFYWNNWQLVHGTTCVSWCIMVLWLKVGVFLLLILKLESDVRWTLVVSVGFI